MDVPHGSYNASRLMNIVVEFGRSLQLDTVSDGNGNILIRKPASKGQENSPIVCLQAHLDMVAVKDEDSVREDTVDRHIADGHNQMIASRNVHE